MKRLLWVVLWVVCLTAQARAQTTSDAHCEGMTEADCFILQKNELAMQAITSFAVQVDGHLTFHDLPDFDGTMRFGLFANGNVTGDFNALTLTPEEEAAFSSAQDAQIQNTIRLFEELQFDLTTELKMPEILVGLYNGDLPLSVPLHLVLTDSNLYLDMTPLRDALGRDGQSLPRGWWGINMIDIILLDLQSSGPQPPAPEIDPDLIDAINESAWEEQWVTQERLADGVALDGTPVATFRTTVDFSAIWEVAELREAVFDVAASEGYVMTGLKSEDMSLLIAFLLENLSMEMTRTIGLTDYYTRSVSLAMRLDMEPMTRLLSILDGDPSVLLHTLVTLEFTMHQSRFNMVEDIETPPGATLFPLDMFDPFGPPLQAKRIA